MVVTGARSYNRAVRPVCVIDVVGLTPGLLGPETPKLNAIASAGFQAPLGTVLPAVTCSVQSTFLTGLMPRDHGVVGNGWYFRDLAEVLFWRQANTLVSGEKVWEAGRARDKAFTCAKLFWWFNMYSSADWSVTPRPAYPADGRKVPDIYSEPPELRQELKQKLGAFPLSRGREVRVKAHGHHAGPRRGWERGERVWSMAMQ